ncbi:MAG TPA: DUF2243 domain-containing protein [Burkholderiales bacterium]|nr:DUF2243 domain-containing protein [Burkholderiales bacterium]
MPGALLIGFGIFNAVEGIVNHHLIGLRHVNETVTQEQWKRRCASLAMEDGLDVVAVGIQDESGVAGKRRHASC